MNTHLILNIPHASTWIPEDCFAKDSEEYRILKEDQINMTDWYTDEMFSNGLGIPVIAPVSRMVCDTERFRSDADEPMSKIGMGVCYETTSDLKHKIKISTKHRDLVLGNYYDIHHKSLEMAVDRANDLKGHVFIMDCHSFSSTPLPYEPDQKPNRPDICIGTDSFHTPKELLEITHQFFSDKGYSVKNNSPYAGTIVPLKHLCKNKDVHSIMIELNRALYLKEGTNEKNAYFSTLKQHLKEYQSAVISI